MRERFRSDPRASRLAPRHARTRCDELRPEARGRRGEHGWVYEYGNTTPIEKRDALATGLELGVQLRGEWFHHGARTGARVFGPGSVHVISPSEQYDLTCCATRHETGLQVGFIVYPDEIENFSPSDQDLVFAHGASLDRRLAELCRAYVDAVDRGTPLPHAQVRSEVLRWVGANVETTPPDPVVSAKRFLDRTFASPLYLQHLAEAAGMKSQVVFSRKFARRFGLTPIAYRTKLRLNEAARLTWSRPDLSISEIAGAVGFEDESYFHRAFVSAHKMTPAQYGGRAKTGPRR